jgi:pimeloyl-ACP methyl ester carboxylesterase
LDPRDTTYASSMTTTRDHDLQLADGRALRYQIAGTAHGHAVFLTDAAAHLFANLREGLALGAEGGIEDELALVAPWEVDLAGVRVPVGLWSGEQDTNTPAGHARWLATAIPGAELPRFPEEGHLSLVYRREREVLDWLAQQLAGTAHHKPPGFAQRPWRSAVILTVRRWVPGKYAARVPERTVTVT